MKTRTSAGLGQRTRELLAGWEAVTSRERVFTILVVEDHGFIASEFGDAIRKHGGRVVRPVARVSHALALIEAAECDGALLDIRIRDGETAYPVADHLHAKGIPFVFVTGWDRDFGDRYRDKPVLRKPFGEAELDSSLRMLIDNIFHPIMKTGEKLATTAWKQNTPVSRRSETSGMGQSAKSLHPALTSAYGLTPEAGAPATPPRACLASKGSHDGARPL